MTKTYLHRHRVTFDETNVVGNVYFAHFLHWQGHCREHFLAERAPGVLSAFDDGLALVTVACDVEFHAEARAFDLVDVHMGLELLAGNRIMMTFDYLRTGSPGPELLARGHQTVACMRRAGQALEPVPVPAELAAALSQYESGSGC